MTPHGAPGGATLHRLFNGCYATNTVPLPFLDGIVVRSYVITAQRGPFIIYNSPGIDLAAPQIQQLGTPERLFLNHGHEAMYGQPDLAVPVYVHERDRAEAQRSMRVSGTFTERHPVGTDFEVIPSSSHTPGTTFYLWDSGDHRFLFPGDAIWVEHGVWKAVILADSNRQAFLDTLELMRQLDFDVLVPWHAPHDAVPYDLVTPQQKRAQIEQLMGRIADGASGPRA